ncbi:Integrator complex subunit 7 [Armadillidium nasatum]|uniref:Integrator complex subunit 7 n=1 Tax=Armadillidium nasatum TaxID=96803 RepID=A0A5N5T3Q3_9CRUS|nr:Integrator complex subunit 7 [Armadillidium nasatum]
MATLLSRPVSFPDIGISDQDEDPNSALLELDRGLKSTQIGDQCEAISRFPALFEKYPFPILINSALLKLAEVFRQETPGSNFVRVCVVEVIETCGKHLDKLINIEEFLRRITAVSHSNDPMARALTLHTLGWISVVVGENRQVHHLIREALDAKDSAELQAAIFAAEKYAAKSKTFAMNMCERLTSMITGLATPVDVKLQLIKIFQHMHHDVETAATVRNLCLHLLKEYPTQRVAITTLHTLTELAAHSLVDIPQQVDLLIECLESDARLGIRRSILDELNYLAQASPHAWTSQNINALIKFAHNSIQNTDVECSALNILSSLISSPEFCHSDKTTEVSLLELSRKCINNSNIRIATKGLLLFTNMALYVYEELDVLTLVEEAVDGALYLMQTIIASNSQKKFHSCLASCLDCIVALTDCGYESCGTCVHILLDTLNNKSLSEKNEELIAKTLASLGGSHSKALSTSLDKLIILIQQLSSQSPLSEHQTVILNCLITLLFQTFHCREWIPQGKDTVVLASKAVNQWTGYRMARQASRYGHHNLAYNIYNTLSFKVCSDHQHFWLQALAEISRGESLVVTEGDRADNLMGANFFLLRALSSLKAASGVNAPLHFPQEYVGYRAEALMCHAQLLHACLSLRTAPPPAIAAPMVASASGRDDLLRCGRVAQQLSKSLRDFHSLAIKYGKLYQSSFDADPITLCNLALLQEGTNLMSKAIELITRHSTGAPSQFSAPDLTSIKNKLGKKGVIEIQSLMKTINEGSLLAQKLVQVCSEVKPIREQHLHLLQDISHTLTSIPHPYPRFFFQKLQQTTITLNLSPQPRTPSDPISVTTSGHLAIKVEGVIVHGRHLGLYRNVQTVSLSINSVIQNRPAHTLDMKIEPNESLSQTVRPHNDFFTTHFLLGFPIPGNYQVTVEASVTDSEDDVWQTGPSLSLSVKAQDDSSTKVTATQPRPPVAGSFTAPLPGPSRASTSTAGVTVEPFVTTGHQTIQQHPPPPPPPPTVRPL